MQELLLTIFINNIKTSLEDEIEEINHDKIYPEAIDEFCDKVLRELRKCPSMTVIDHEKNVDELYVYLDSEASVESICSIVEAVVEECATDITLQLDLFTGKTERVKYPVGYNTEPEIYTYTFSIDAEWDYELEVDDSLTESKSYGGAFDIEDDQYFTREDLDDFSCNVVEKVNGILHLPVDYSGSWIDNNVLTVSVAYQDSEIEVSTTVDMRRIRLPKQLDKYMNEIVADIVDQAYQLDEDSQGSTSIEESVQSENTTDLKTICDEVDNFLKDNPDTRYVVDNLWYEEDKNRICLTIYDGDWKHEHLFIDFKIEEFFRNKGIEIERWSESIGESDSDCYSAAHYYEIMSDEPFSVEFDDSLTETYWINNKDVMNEVKRLGNELEAEGWKYYGDKYSGSKYYDFYMKRGDSGAICKAIQFNHEGVHVIDITVDQMMGYEAIDDFDNLRRTLGKALLPQRESVDKQSIQESVEEEDQFVLYFPYIEPKIINRERAIRQLEIELENFKNDSGASLAGRGFGIYCLQSVDKDTGTVWTGRHSSREFLKVLDESMLKEASDTTTDDVVESVELDDMSDEEVEL